MFVTLVKNRKRTLLIILGLIVAVLILIAIVVSNVAREARVKDEEMRSRFWAKHHVELLRRKVAEEPSIALCESAEKYLELALKENESQVMPRDLRAVLTCFHNLPQYDNNLKEHRLNTLHEKLQSPRLKGISFSFKSRHALVRRDYESALNHARESARLLEIANRDYSNAFSFALSEAYRSVGASYYHMSRFDDAITYYRKSVDLNPKNHATLNAIGVTLLRKNPDNHAAAKGYFLRALEINPSDWRTLYSLAFTLRDTDPQESIRYAAKLLSVYEHFGYLPDLMAHNEALFVLSARLILARGHYKLGDTRAVKLYEKAQAMVEDYRDELLKIDETEDLQWVWEIEEELKSAKVNFGL